MNSVHIPNELNNLLKENHVHIQLSVPQLVEKVLKRKEGSLTSTGAIREQRELIQDVPLKINIL